VPVPSVPDRSNNDPPRRRRRRPRLVFFILFATFAVLLAPVWFPLISASDDNIIQFERAQRRWRTTVGLPMPGAPDTARLTERLAEHGMAAGTPVLVRIFKREFELELWMKRGGSFAHFATYPICRWSGTLGPKLQQGDSQAPEGFYSVDANALNPNSKWYRSFNVGYPNAFDAANGRTGSLIMVHGGCASVGCFAMTNGQMAEIWQLVTAALNGGQKRFQVQTYPFRMTDANIANHASHPALPFWQTLKRGHDLFEASHLPPRVHVCRTNYEFRPSGVYPDGDGGIENSCPASEAKS
jgi:murein L,D-transpeptidase YafK